MKKLLIYGYGYTASYLVETLNTENYLIIGSSREEKKFNSDNKKVKFINNSQVNNCLLKDDITHILVSVPPNDLGDIFIQNYRDIITKNKNIEWIGYLSATNVYGDHNGELVSESSQTKPKTKKGINRLVAEKQWLELISKFNLPIKIFRLAGIYGPNRNIKERLIKGLVKNIFKEGQFFSRIHVEDIANILNLSMNNITKNKIYNLADDFSCNLNVIIEYLCEKNSLIKPAQIDFDDMSLDYKKESFFLENKRVDNSLVKKDLLKNFKYPSFKEGYKNL
ncbi:NAD-dependent epimerase/dehydratase family protein [Pelagibacteraceae bacterium]|jgi:nucleoside-diphosphate-sugar epimerase|nr:NAD-dependent epimerase/dehydratase family protein [Pelagibacteraceae bacterium]